MSEISRPPANGSSHHSELAARKTPNETAVYHREGPLPAPHELAGYQQILPDAPERILKMAEDEQRFRHQLEISIAQADIQHRQDLTRLSNDEAAREHRSEMLGQGLGFFIALLCILAAAYGLYAGRGWEVIVPFLGLPIASIIQAIRSSRKAAQPPPSSPEK